MSELMDAIRAGDEARVEAIVQSDPAALATTENGVTPVLLALYHGRAEMARRLASRGTLSFGEACALGDEARIDALLASDPALLHSRTADGFPAFALAVFFRQPAMVRKLIAAGADVNAAAENAMRVAPVHAATAARDHETMALLLEHGADPNARQQQDYTPLHEASGRGDMEMAKLLLRYGADRTAVSEDGMTASDIARKNGHREFADWLDGA